MNWIDIVLALPIVWFAWRGFGKGFIIEVSTLVGLIIGIYVALNFSWVIKSVFYKLEIYGDYIHIIALSITFVITVMFIVWLGRAIERLFDVLALSFLDKGIGAIFGALKAAVLISVVLFIIKQSGLENQAFAPTTRANSIVYEPIASIVPTALTYFNIEDLHIDTEKIKKDLGVNPKMY